MDAIALNWSAGWPSSTPRTIIAPPILRSQQLPFTPCTCHHHQQLRSPPPLPPIPFQPHPKIGIQSTGAPRAEIITPPRRSESGRRRRRSTEHGINATGQAWQLKHDTNCRGVDIRNSSGSNLSENFRVCHGASGSLPFAEQHKNQLQRSVTAYHHHAQHPNSNGFAISPKLDLGWKLSPKQKRGVWQNPGGIVWAKQGGNGRARRGVEANLAEAPLSSREEASGAIEAQQAGGTTAATAKGYDGGTSTSILVLDREPITGGAVDFHGATLPLTNVPLVVTKKIVIVRHGLSSWNAESRIQGSSDLSKLSEEGIAQAERCKQSLANLTFSACFSSPISRARTSAEVIWSGREEPLVFLDSLKEANLLFLEGMRNVDAKEQYPEQYNAWREDPVSFNVDGVYPVVQLWKQAKEAWQEILSADGDLVLVITHKSILRALLCTALGLGPERFRSVDINNGGISVFTVNTRGEPMLQCLNMTSHLHVDGVYY